MLKPWGGVSTRASRPPSNTGCQAGEPASRSAMIRRQSGLRKVGPAQTAPWNGSEMKENIIGELSDPKAPRLGPKR